MRLRAYGGNRIGERARIGDWSEFPSGELEDDHGLTRGELAYGVGVLPPAPFLVLRERQSAGPRFYSFTLLLDPGRDVWIRFRWNGAALVSALLADAGFFAQLRARPEDVSPSALRERFAALAPPAASARAAPSRVAVALTAVPLGGAELVLGTRQLGLAARPSPAEMAELVDGVPPALRTGLGWLVGGRRGSGPAFGCGLVLDDADPRETASPEGEELLRRAERTLAACRLLESAGDTPASVREVLATPLAEWTAAPAALLASMTLLGELSSARPAPELVAEAARAATSEATPLAAELQGLLVRRLQEEPALVRAALERGRALGLPAWRWGMLRERPELSTLLVGPLQREAQTGLTREDRDSHLSYALLAHDPGGERLAGTHPDLVPPLVETLLLRSREGGPWKSDVDAWLGEAARTSLRTLLPVTTKKRIADAVGGHWTRFRALWAVCHGESDVRLPRGKLAGREAQLLEMELPAVLGAAREGPAGVKLLQLDLHRLSSVVGTKLSPKTLDLSRRVVSDAWKDPHAEELPLWKDSEPAVRREVLPELLFGAGPERDALYRTRLEMLLAEEPERDAVHAALARVRSLPIPQAAARFFRRFAPEPELAERALDLFEPGLRKELVDAGPAAAREAFDAVARGVLRRALSRPPSLGPRPDVSRAFLHLLLGGSAEGRAALARLARSVMGSEADDVRGRLAALLLPREKGTAHDEDPFLSKLVGKLKDRLKR